MIKAFYLQHDDLLLSASLLLSAADALVTYVPLELCKLSEVIVLKI